MKVRERQWCEKGNAGQECKKWNKERALKAMLSEAYQLKGLAQLYEVPLLQHRPPQPIIEAENLP
jgi:hypothetical protein